MVTTRRIQDKITRNLSHFKRIKPKSRLTEGDEKESPQSYFDAQKSVTISPDSSKSRVQLSLVSISIFSTLASTLPVVIISMAESQHPPTTTETVKKIGKNNVWVPCFLTYQISWIILILNLSLQKNNSGTI